MMLSRASHMKARVKRFVEMELHHLKDKNAMMEITKTSMDAIPNVVLRRTLSVK
jgi:hypothetical protein